MKIKLFSCFLIIWVSLFVTAGLGHVLVSNSMYDDYPELLDMSINSAKMNFFLVAMDKWKDFSLLPSGGVGGGNGTEFLTRKDIPNKQYQQQQYGQLVDPYSQNELVLLPAPSANNIMSFNMDTSIYRVRDYPVEEFMTHLFNGKDRYQSAEMILNAGANSEVFADAYYIWQYIRKVKGDNVPSEIAAILASATSFYSQTFGVPENAVVGVMQAESSFNINAKSNMGAMGPMQVMWNLHYGLLNSYGLNKATDLNDPDLGVRAGCLLLSRYLKEQKNLPGALSRYLGELNKNYVSNVYSYSGAYGSYARGAISDVAEASAKESDRWKQLTADAPTKQSNKTPTSSPNRNSTANNQAGNREPSGVPLRIVTPTASNNSSVPSNNGGSTVYNNTGKSQAPFGVLQITKNGKTSTVTFDGTK